MAEPDDEIDYEKILSNHVSQLMEMFESVRIFATRDGGDVTMARDWGGGNFYATLGQVREWLVKQDHRARVQVERADSDEDPEDDP